MTKTQQLIAELHDARDWSWYRVAKELGITPQRLYDFRTGREPRLPVHLALRVAELLERDPLAVVAEIEADRAKRTEEREFWMRVAKSAAATILALLLPLASVLDAPTAAKDLRDAFNHARHYAKWLARLLRLRVAV
ncbi:MAG: hypothetical protein GWO02_05115 [Gammaproteobacteria bacterium]|nr:hypothetical protein [Gammaproteobacteria bacterium]